MARFLPDAYRRDASDVGQGLGPIHGMHHSCVSSASHLLKVAEDSKQHAGVITKGQYNKVASFKRNKKHGPIMYIRFADSSHSMRIMYTSYAELDAPPSAFYREKNIYIWGSTLGLPGPKNPESVKLLHVNTSWSPSSEWLVCGPTKIGSAEGWTGDTSKGVFNKTALRGRLCAACCARSRKQTEQTETQTEGRRALTTRCKWATCKCQERIHRCRENYAGHSYDTTSPVKQCF